MNEADTCRTYIMPKLKSAGWEDDFIAEQMVLIYEQIILYLNDLPSIDDYWQAKVNGLQGLQTASKEESSVFTSSLLDKIFKGEL